MNKSELLRELREITAAGMKDCADALKEAKDDLQKAIDIIKTKGQNIVTSRAGKVASEGVVAISAHDRAFSMVEVNCQTDFVARHPDFVAFANMVADKMAEGFSSEFMTDDLIKSKDSLIAKFKENIVVRRWWVDEPLAEVCKTFSYIHNGSKLGVLITLKAPSAEVAQSDEFNQIGNDLAMHVAAMNPLAISSDKIGPDVLERQTFIFDEQVKSLNKPIAAQPKILEGKFRKWHSEVCLLNQESVLVPKTTIDQLIKGDYAKQLGGELEIVSFYRCQVGEGIEKETSQLANDVAELINNV